MDNENRLGSIIVDTAFRISSKLGPGLMESVYETVFARDLARRGLQVERQHPISFDFEGLWFEHACRIDLWVERAVIIEIKSASQFRPGDYKQVLTYLRLTDCRLGYLINFGAPTIKEGIRRIIS